MDNTPCTEKCHCTLNDLISINQNHTNHHSAVLLIDGSWFQHTLTFSSGQCLPLLSYPVINVLISLTLFGLGGGGEGPLGVFAKYLKNGLANLHETL